MRAKSVLFTGRHPRIGGLCTDALDHEAIDAAVEALHGELLGIANSLGLNRKTADSEKLPGELYQDLPRK